MKKSAVLRTLMNGNFGFRQPTSVRARMIDDETLCSKYPSSGRRVMLKSWNLLW